MQIWICGYLHDTETQLYYLQSRYYDPKVGRFLNRDEVFDTDAGLQGFNLFAYCGNNPICRIDVSGRDSEKNEDLDLVDDEMHALGGGSAFPVSPQSPTPAAKNMWLELFDMLNQAFKDGLGGMRGVFRTSFSDSYFLPDNYYTDKKAPKLYTPNSVYTNWKYKVHTQEYEYSTVYYDHGGRQVLRVDWTSHGYPDHTNPHVHFRVYDGTYPEGIDIKKLKNG